MSGLKEVEGTISEIVLHLNHPSLEPYDRRRGESIAVTQEEYDGIKEYRINKYGEFNGKVGGVNLVIDNEVRK